MSTDPNKISMALSRPRRTRNFFMNNAIYIVLLLLCVLIVIIDTDFLSWRNVFFILSQSSSRIIIALGVAGIIVLGGTDLSAGRSVGMAGILAASLLQATNYSLRIFKDMDELPLWLPLALCMAVCAGFSVIQGLMVAKFRIAPFITSLGFQMVIYGVQSVYFDRVNSSSPIGGLSRAYASFAQGSRTILGMRVSYIVIYAVIVTALVWFVWNEMALGKNMFALGGNREAAIVSGVNVAGVTVLVYLLAGLLYGFAGFIEAARTGSATNNLGFGYELDAIAACVVGGVSLQGGLGSISGVITGVLIFQVINYGLNFIDINPYVQFIIKGAIILFAITIDTQKYIKKR